MTLAIATFKSPPVIGTSHLVAFVCVVAILYLTVTLLGDR